MDDALRGGRAANPAVLGQPDDASSAAGPRDEAVRALNRELLCGTTTTVALLRWCDARGIGAGPISIGRCPDQRWREPNGMALEALRLRPGEVLAHRRVRLVRGGAVLAWADNWFVPGRLPAPLRRAIETTQAPFGAVVAPLRPVRCILGVRPSRAASPGGPTVPDRRYCPGFRVILEQEALLRNRSGQPLCAVHERFGEALVC